MNVSCIICSDLLQPSAEIFVTPCGHMFHYACLIQWLERSKSCPQCRNRCTEKTIHRIYFNITNTDHITDDVATLQFKLDNAQFQNKVKDKETQVLSDKYKKFKKMNAALRAEVAELEAKLRADDSVKHALKDQITFYKSKAKENDRLCEEIVKLKIKLRDVEAVQTAITGSREEVNEMLRNENNVESLAILAATLKKALIDAEKKKRDVEHKLKRALQDDIAKYRREVSSLELQNKELRKELDTLRSTWDLEKQVLRKKLAEVTDKMGTSPNTSVKRLITESPVPIAKKLDLDNEGSEIIPKPAEIPKPTNSSLEYLQVKVNNTGFNMAGPGRLPTTTAHSKSVELQKYSIFKSGPTSSMMRTGQTSKPNGVVYNGLGGRSKEDIFPSPKPAPVTLKRPRSSAVTSSAKYKKMTPLAGLANK